MPLYYPPGATISQFPSMPVPLATSSAYSGATTTTAGGSRTTLSMYVSPFPVEESVTFNQVMAHISFNTVAGTGSFTNGQMWGLYSKNGASLSLASSFMFVAMVSQNSVSAQSQYYHWGTNSTSNSYSSGGNISASLQGLKAAIIRTGGSSISPGQYYLVHAQSMSTAGAAIGSFSNMAASYSQTTGGSIIGSNVFSRAYPYIGIASTTVTNAASGKFVLPNAIETTAITGTGGSSQSRSNFLQFAYV